MPSADILQDVPARGLAGGMLPSRVQQIVPKWADPEWAIQPTNGISRSRHGALQSQIYSKRPQAPPVLGDDPPLKRQQRPVSAPAVEVHKRRTHRRPSSASTAKPQHWSEKSSGSKAAARQSIISSSSTPAMRRPQSAVVNGSSSNGAMRLDGAKKEGVSLIGEEELKIRLDSSAPSEFSYQSKPPAVPSSRQGSESSMPHTELLRMQYSEEASERIMGSYTCSEPQHSRRVPEPGLADPKALTKVCSWTPGRFVGWIQASHSDRGLWPQQVMAAEEAALGVDFRRNRFSSVRNACWLG
jgi:hypothetical protein